MNRDHLGSFSAKGNRSCGRELSAPPLSLWFSLIHLESLPVEVVPVEFFFGGVRGFYRIHFDESKALRAAGLSVFDHLARFHSTRMTEKLADFLTGRVRREITNKQFS